MGNLDQKLFLTLFRCYSSVEQKVFPEIKLAGLTESQFLVLEFLYTKGPASINEIVEKTFSSGGNITVVLNNLENSQYINREKSAKDKRISLVKITPLGTAILQEALLKHEANLKDVFRILSEAEKETMTKLLKKLGKS